eukprot:330622-Pyramimonas_sp.AAC.1
MQVIVLAIVFCGWCFLAGTMKWLGDFEFLRLFLCPVGLRVVHSGWRPLMSQQCVCVTYRDCPVSR